tara:strand:- start:167 stop:676 length:510 start_codon:yes stop_codon:yes gene_type:complete
MNQILEEAMKEKNILISEMKSIILSTNSFMNIPNSSYAPSIQSSDGNFYIYVSELSKHTSNIIVNPKISIMIIEDESKSDNLFARKRLTIECDSYKLDRNLDEWKIIIEEMQLKLGDTIKFLKDMKDFHLFKLIPESGLLVYGFGKAFRLKGKNLDEFDHLNDKGHKKN